MHKIFKFYEIEKLKPKRKIQGDLPPRRYCKKYKYQLFRKPEEEETIKNELEFCGFGIRNYGKQFLFHSKNKYFA